MEQFLWIAVCMAVVLAGLVPWIISLKRRIARYVQAETSLRFTQFAVDHSADAAFWARSDGRLVYVNRAACRSLGYSRDELLRLAVSDVDPDYSDETWRRFWEEMKQSVSLTVESCHRTKDGRIFPVEITANFERFADEEYTCAFVRNISARKQAEEELRKHREHLEELVAQRTEAVLKTIEELRAEVVQRKKAEEELKRIFDLSLDMICIADNDGYFRKINPSFGRVLGYCDEELVSRPYLEFVHPDDIAKTLEVIKEKLARGDVVINFENRYRCKDGSVKWLMWTSRPVPEEGLLYSIARDATEQKLAEEELTRHRDHLEELVAERTAELTTANEELQREMSQRQQAEKERETLIVKLEAQNAELERFAYTISHDLKTPLITLKAFMGAMQEDLAKGDQEAVDDDVARMSGAADKMVVLLGDLLELSRIGRLVKPSVDVAVEDLAREAIEMAHAAIQQRGVRTTVSSDLPVVFGDRTRLAEVMQNLVDNAVKYMGDQTRPHLEIGSRQEKGQTVCFVRDNGLGIDPRYQQRVFGLFEQLDRSAEGSGIGLALVRRIVEVHGGRIWVES
ncbi:MAG: PAS domain S-box protein, partial [Planctomycetes bacterium]|nr:PAS domain S-box protein [Planctomycetota bacterium]